MEIKFSRNSNNFQELYQKLVSKDDKMRMKSVETILVLTDQQVDWMYDAWDFLVEMLDHENSFQRSIAINVLCNLAKSDKDNRPGGMLDRLLLHTKDEKFITSRQSLQSIWKIAITNE
jgi:hypothetical protein